MSQWSAPEQQAHARQTVAIIGVGSPFGDDQLGWLAVDWLEQSVLPSRFPGVHLKFAQADRPGALLLDSLRGVDAAIIIDAMMTGAQPGTLRTFTPEQLRTTGPGLRSSHAFGLAESITLGFALGELPSALTIIGIELGRDRTKELLAETTHELLLLTEKFLAAVSHNRPLSRG